jgi:hypothetical protein
LQQAPVSGWRKLVAALQPPKIIRAAGSGENWAASGTGFLGESCRKRLLGSRKLRMANRLRRVWVKSILNCQKANLATPLSDGPGPGFAPSATTGTVTVVQGASATASVSVSVTGGFNSKVSLSATRRAAGIEAASCDLRGAGADPNAAAGRYTITLTATGGGVTKTVSFALTVRCSRHLKPGLSV